jgi:hypothetical protein
VLGPPDPDPVVNEFSPSNKPQELLSLGHGGEIVLEFTDNYIYDGAGVDFTVFENVFTSFFTGGPYIEAGIVAASMDGITFVEFPYDTSTWEGLAGVTPIQDNQNPADPAVSGGDQFDLADIGLAYAQFIRITDLGDIKQEGLYNGDFDLDAVVAVNSRKGNEIDVTPEDTNRPSMFQLSQNYPNPFNPETAIAFSLDKEREIELTIFNALGQEVRTLVSGRQSGGTHTVTWNGKNQLGVPVTSGIYIYQLKSGDSIEIRRMALIR